MDKLKLNCFSLCIGQEDNDDGYRIIRAEGEYDGETNEKGQKHGHGRYLFSNGDSYDGEWKRDKMHGFGEYRSASGEIYRGSFKKGKRVQSQQSQNQTTLREHLLPQDENRQPRQGKRQGSLDAFAGSARSLSEKVTGENQPRQGKRPGSLDAFAEAARRLSENVARKKSKKGKKRRSEEQMPSCDIDGPTSNRPVRDGEAIPQERVRRPATMNERLRKDADMVKAKWNFRKSK